MVDKRWKGENNKFNVVEEVLKHKLVLVLATGKSFHSEFQN